MVLRYYHPSAGRDCWHCLNHWWTVLLLWTFWLHWWPRYFHLLCDAVCINCPRRALWAESAALKTWYWARWRECCLSKGQRGCMVIMRLGGLLAPTLPAVYPHPQGISTVGIFKTLTAAVTACSQPIVEAKLVHHGMPLPCSLGHTLTFLLRVLSSFNSIYCNVRKLE